MFTSLLTLGLLSADALACGGLFCSAPTLPVDQTGERIVFAIDREAGKIEMHTQISYEGPAETFAWLVPVPQVPELMLGTDELFSMLDRNTAPIFQLVRTSCFPSESDGSVNDTDVVSDTGAGGGVVVIQESAVGPYQTVTLQGDSSEAILEWLNTNGYYVPSTVGPSLDPYIATGSYIVALRLLKDKEIGDLAPLAMRWAGDTPIIPLTMTAVAAMPDMSLIPWVLSDGRAVPENYMHVVLNELAIDWWTAGSNYSAIVTAAANQAGGQAFATDFAGPTEPMRSQLVWPGRFNVAELRNDTTLRELINTILVQGFVRDQSLVDLLASFHPEASTLLSFAGGGDTGGTSLLEPCVQETDVGCAPIDANPVVDALVTSIIEPLENAEDLIQRYPFITRLTSSASPDEMTVDPRFVINPSMPEVPQRRTATLESDCDGDEHDRLILADGTELPIPNQSWLEAHGMTLDDWMAPFREYPLVRVEQTGRSGAPVVFVDTSAEIDAWVQSRYAELGLSPTGADVPDKDAGTCGCRTGSPGAFAALGLLLLRRRRR